MPTTKITGPHQIAAYNEGTPFTAQALVLNTGWLRALSSEIGDITTERTDIEVSQAGRGQFHEVEGRIPDCTFKIELPFQGSGTDAVDFDGRQSLWQASGFTAAESGTVSYTLAANPANTATIYRVDRQAILGEYLHGAIVEKLEMNFDKKEAPKMVFSGKAARKVEFLATTLGAAITTTDGTSITLSDLYCIRDGSDAGTLANMAIYVKIDSEILKITGYVQSTGVATVARGQLGTSGATHLISVAVTPLATGITYEDAAADLIAGPHHWTCAISSLGDDAIRGVQYSIDTGRAFDELCAGQQRSAALHNKGLRVTGQLTYIHNKTRHHMGMLADAHTSLSIVTTVGPISTGAPDVWTVTAGNCYLTDGIAKNPKANEVCEVTVPFKALDSAIDTLDAINVTINVP